MKAYESRLIDSLIKRKLKSAGAVVLRGPRAVGKTTSALCHAASSFRLDQRKDLINAAELTPATLLAGPVPRLVDEWQLAPSIWNSIWAEIDCPAWHGLVTAVAINALRDDMDSLADVDLRSLPCRGFDQWFLEIVVAPMLCGGRTRLVRPSEGQIA